MKKLLIKELLAAADRARKRVSKMTKEKRKKLSKKAFARFSKTD